LQEITVVPWIRKVLFARTIHALLHFLNPLSNNPEEHEPL